MTNGRRKSDGPIVPAKRSNKADRSAAESVEGRGPAEGNTAKRNAPRTQRRKSAPNDLDRVRQVAKRDRRAKFTALLHHVTIDRLRGAFGELKKKAAPGVDGVTWQHYEENLETNLQDLHGRLNRGAYRPKPSRRVFIPKNDGRLRPLGVASLEDKLVQRAVVEVLNAIYESDFLGFSYGFRPERSQHDALDALAAGILRKNVNWVLDADVRGFFDNIDHAWLMRFVEHRIADKRILRLIQKWLKAGVIDQDRWTVSELGTPQGATASPLLANVYLHYVLDLWVEQWRNRHAKGNVIVTRFADDFIVGFQQREDAEEFLRALKQRLAEFSLELHPEKTRLIEFGRFAAARRARRGERRPETFAFLGFTHICGRSRFGNFLLIRRTMHKRLQAKLREIRDMLWRRRHDPPKAQGRWLAAVMRGYFAYFAVPTNSHVLASFRHAVERHWYRALARRGQRTRRSWDRIRRLSRRWLPKVRVQHPWPEDRFDVRTRGGSRVR